MNLHHRQSEPSIDTPGGRLKPPSSGVTLWKPELVLVGQTTGPVAHRPLVMPGEPALRPEAVRAQVDAAQSLLRSFAQAREELETQAARAEVRGHHAGSDRQRVSAAMETYRLKAELDDMLTATMRRMTALMEGRRPR